MRPLRDSALIMCATGPHADDLPPTVAPRRFGVITRLLIVGFICVVPAGTVWWAVVPFSERFGVFVLPSSYLDRPQAQISIGPELLPREDSVAIARKDSLASTVCWRRKVAQTSAQANLFS
jgi:hypothetical protein